jgi:hypothetical protein
LETIQESLETKDAQIN